MNTQETLFMTNSKYLILATLVSFSSFGAVSFEEKKNRVEEMMKLQSTVPAIAFDGYRRELNYEQKGLSVEARAKNETNLLAEKVRTQVISAYEAALAEHQSPELARQEVREAITRDLEHASPELKEEIKNLALQTLEDAEHGEINQPVNMSSVEEAMAKQVVSRKDFLNAEGAFFSPNLEPVANPGKDAEKKDYATKAELIESLVSERDSSRGVPSSSQKVDIIKIKKFDGRVSFQVKMEFLGATLDAGPTIAFRRETVSTGGVIAEGNHPILISGKLFDRYKRDREGKILMKNGKPQMRYSAFWCDLNLRFESEYTGGGGFHYMGLGGGASVTNIFAHALNSNSRRVAVPESVEGKHIDLEYITKICHESYPKGKISNTMTIRQSLDVSMKHILSGLVFTNPKTKCATDTHCRDWWEKEIPALQKKNNTYRCVEHSADKYRFCQVRGLAKQACPVIEGGRRVSHGLQEYPCDWKFKCVKKSNASFVVNMPVAYAKGVCE